MMNYYAYKNKLWRTFHRFSYTGESKSFTLNPGEYLFICRGANGGQGAGSTFINKGGVSYGIMNLEQTTTMYAVVGGNGGDVEETGAIGADGGFNGGGRGGLETSRPYIEIKTKPVPFDPTQYIKFYEGQYLPGEPGDSWDDYSFWYIESTFCSGAGGGGGTDVRLYDIGQVETFSKTFTLPSEYDALEYIESDGVYNWIQTEYVPNAKTKIETDMMFLSGGTDFSQGLFGTYHISSFAIYGRYSGDYVLRYTRGPDHIDSGDINIPTDQKIHITAYGDNAKLYREGDENPYIDITLSEADLETCESPMTIFAINQSRDIITDDVTSKSKARLYGMVIYENNVPDKYYVPVQRNTPYEMDISSSEFEQGTITSSGDSSNSKRIRSVLFYDANILRGEIKVYATATNGNQLEWAMPLYKEDQRNSQYIITSDSTWKSYGTGSTSINDFQYTRYVRIVLRRSNGSSITPAQLATCHIVVEGPQPGIYDVLNNKFYSNTSKTMLAGPVISDFPDIQITFPVDSMHSRIIVAGGGGGGTNVDTTSIIDYAGYGGGTVGGYSYTNAGGGQPSTQTSGYEFGYGEDGQTPWSMSTGSQRGRSGGGGGWYGGFACPIIYVGDDESGNGGGGSGYALTATSAIPTGYISSFIQRTDLLFTDVVLNSGCAETSEVIICKRQDEYYAGDTIICECIGEDTSFWMKQGIYNVQCWGGDGGTRYRVNRSSRGGYVKGTFTNPTAQTVYAYVGGSGLYGGTVLSGANAQISFPTLSFNGGGKPSSYTGLAAGSAAAGGGTDLRIGTDSLYSRIIVAGGAGGMGCVTSRGGVGGGESGGSYINDSGTSSYGTNYGPGTQTNAGSGSVSAISAGFGFGGNGMYSNYGYGGAGGGGWYGGSGTRPNASDDNDAGGCGGSGFTFKQSSTVPSGYLLDSQYYMTNTYQTPGGNDLMPGLTKMIISCEATYDTPLLAFDDDGCKYYNDISDRWEFLKSDTPTLTDFEQFGCYKMTTDDGLLNNYSVYILNHMGALNTAYVRVYPPKQTIFRRYPTKTLMSKCLIDRNVDEENVSLNITTNREGVGDSAHIDFTIEYDIHDTPKIDTRIYSIYGYGEGSLGNGGEPTPHPKTLDHIDLLQTRVSNGMPSRYKNYMGETISGGTAISSISAGVCCESNRCIYAAAICNDSIVRFSKLNLVTNTSYILKDIPKAQIGGIYLGDIKVSEEYIYLTSSTNNSEHVLYRIPLNGTDTTVKTYTFINNSKYNFQAVGKMEWWDEKTLFIHHQCGFFLFDTVNETYQNFEDSTLSWSGGRRDYAVGEKYIMSITTATTSDARIYDIENNTWSSMSTKFNKSWAGTYLTCCCYHEGKFYVVQQGTLHIVDEETWDITEITAPFSSFTPKTVSYGKGVLYITIQNQPIFYIYDIKNDFWSSGLFPFTMDNWTGNGWMRGCTFDGFFFVPNVHLYVVNFNEYAKYNIGANYDQFMLPFDENNEQYYTYDPIFVKFTTSGAVISSGELTRPLFTVDPENYVYKFDMRKSDYNKFISLRLVKDEIINQEEGDQNNG